MTQENTQANAHEMMIWNWLNSMSDNEILDRARGHGTQIRSYIKLSGSIEAAQSLIDSEMRGLGTLHTLAHHTRKHIYKDLLGLIMHAENIAYGKTA